MKIAALVLAAGESKRMGQPKLLLPLTNGKPIIIQTIENILAASVTEVVVVLGGEREKIKRALDNYLVQVTFNPLYKQGMLSSIQWGLKHLPPETEAVLICLGDQPDIPPEVHQALIKAYHQSQKGIIIPVFQGHRGHPLLLDLKYKADVFQLDPTIGLRQLVYSHPEDTLEVEVSTPNILQDIDTYEDYLKIT